MNKTNFTFRTMAAGVTFIIGVALSLLAISRPRPLWDLQSADLHPSVQHLHPSEIVSKPVEVVSEPVSELASAPDHRLLSHARLPDGHLLVVGDFHGEEVKARTGEKWLGLYVTKGGASTLISTILNVKIVKDELVDGRDSQANTGKRVTVKRKPDPVFLVKGAGTLKPGAVETLFLGAEPVALSKGSDVEFTLREKKYHLKVSTADHSGANYIARNDAKLVLASGKTEQVLYELGGNGEETEAYWYLIWAGDADGDGQLDLYLDVSDHYNVSQRKLFLSSQARSGGLVREEAELITLGC